MNLKNFSLLIKPTSSDCNQRCAYCFYLSRSSLYPEFHYHRMSNDVLEKMIAGFMATGQPHYAFGWQGGEPTLMGVDFFRQVTDLQQKYGHPGVIVSNGLQTNATLIDDELAAHLSKFHFLVGVSLDGPAEVHDYFRKTQDGRGSHQAVLNGITCLRRHRVEFNALTLIHSMNVSKAREVYLYLQEMGIYYQQYIPCVEFDSGGQMAPFTITGRQWGDFLCSIFDLWYINDTRRISIRLFDSILNFMVYGNYTLCHMGGNCNQYFVVEHNGDIYPCDFFVDPVQKIGNITRDSWPELVQSESYRGFGIQKAAWNSQCYSCEYLQYCSGDCLKHRFYGSERPEQLSWLCEGWRLFYEYTLPRFELIAKSIIKEYSRGVNGIFQPPPGRNAQCFCGSGKKYKKCHGFLNRK